MILANLHRKKVKILNFLVVALAIAIIGGLIGGRAIAITTAAVFWPKKK